MKTISVGGNILEVEVVSVPINKLVPNPNQPRGGPKEDEELRRNIMENGGLTTALLVEKMPNNPDIYKIVDGERRYVNCKELLNENPETKSFLSSLPCDVIQKELSEEERLRIWIAIHRIRKDWKAKEIERTAIRLVDVVGGRVKAAHILGITIRKLDTLIDTYELSERMQSRGEHSISYAREIKSIAKKFMTPEVENVIVEKVNQNIIKSPLHIRNIRKILADEDVTKEFLKKGKTIESALGIIEKNKQEQPATKIPEVKTEFEPGEKLKNTISQFKDTLTGYSWIELDTTKGDKNLLREIDECINILVKVKKTLS